MGKLGAVLLLAAVGSAGYFWNQLDRERADNQRLRDELEQARRETPTTLERTLWRTQTIVQKADCPKPVEEANTASAKVNRPSTASVEKSAALVVTDEVVSEEEKSAVPEPDGEARVQARAAYRDGLIAFRRGNFELAVAEFERGYEIEERPLFLYNAAQAAEKAGDPTKARSLYEKYLLKEPSAPEQSDIKAKLRAL